MASEICPLVSCPNGRGNSSIDVDYHESLESRTCAGLIVGNLMTGKDELYYTPSDVIIRQVVGVKIDRIYIL